MQSEGISALPATNALFRLKTGKNVLTGNKTYRRNVEMIKLHGVPVSNYYNMAKLAMLEKGIDFEEIANPASQETEFKKKVQWKKCRLLKPMTVVCLKRV